MKKLNFYFFGDAGSYDIYNPAYVCNKEHVPELLYLIAHNDAYKIDKNEIINKLNLEQQAFDNAIDSLQAIEAIETRNNTYRIKFPVFLEKDISYLDKYLKGVGKVVGEKIIELKEALHQRVDLITGSSSFSKERLLYHIICDKIFDGTAFDFFAEKDIFCVSKLQPDNRDYIIVAYEDSERIERFSNKLLCSSNNYICSGFCFNSFGDSDGVRKDMYRYFRLVQTGIEAATTFHDLNLAYIKVVEDMNRTLAQKCGELMLAILNSTKSYDEFNEEEKHLLIFLKEMEYISVRSRDNALFVNVPVFLHTDMAVIDEISDIILAHIYPIVKECFEAFEGNAPELTAVKHRVPIKEIGNELWHQIFGAVNEYLAEVGFVQSPNYYQGQGRYLRSVSL